MEPEEMDVVEILQDLPIEPAWHINTKLETRLTALTRGQRGMVVHRHDQTSPLYDVEFLDPATQEPVVLATLPGEMLRVVERDTLAIE